MAAAMAAVADVDDALICSVLMRLLAENQCGWNTFNYAVV